jgi:hypothetical protein
VYDFTVGGLSGTGTLSVSIPADVAVDGAGNGNNSSGQVDTGFDFEPPEVDHVDVVSTEVNPGPPPLYYVTYTIYFTEPVTGFTDAGFQPGASSNALSVAPVDPPALDIGGVLYYYAYEAISQTEVYDEAGTVLANSATDAIGNTGPTSNFPTAMLPVDFVALTEPTNTALPGGKTPGKLPGETVLDAAGIRGGSKNPLSAKPDWRQWVWYRRWNE